MEGTVKWFSQEKGYGFITPESGKDYYFNVQSVQGADLPSQGDIVSFDAKSGSKRPCALNVSIVSKMEKTNNRPHDDRIDCPCCGKKIVPRMITYLGEPDKSVCPYCGETVKEFRILEIKETKEAPIKLILFGVVVLLIIYKANADLFKSIIGWVLILAIVSKFRLHIMMVLAFLGLIVWNWISN